MNMRNFVILILFLILVAAGFFFFVSEQKYQDRKSDVSFSDNDVPSNKNIIPPALEIPEKESASRVYKDLIRIDAPLPESTISSPLIIRGAARGNWFFEASFPVVLVDWDGRIIAEGIAQAEGEWMTSEYVPFTARLEFTPDTRVSNQGALILKKDNPSGLPENDDALEFTIYFAQ